MRSRIDIPGTGLTFGAPGRLTPPARRIARAAKLAGMAVVLLASVVPVLTFAANGIAGEDLFQIARLKYDGGGDWYSNPSSIPNLHTFLRAECGIDAAVEEAVVEPSSPKLSALPFVYMNGHGNIRFSERDVESLRHYLETGGFLLADDNYGMDASFRREMKRVLPGVEPVELPWTHPIYHSHFSLPEGLPKIHEHDGKPAQGLGYSLHGRLVAFYSYQADLGDGWEDPDVHNDPAEKRLAALRMGANIVVWRLRGGL